MITRTLAAGLLAAGCITAAGAGAYIGVREGASTAPAPAVAAPEAQPVAEPAPVSETEAIIATPPEPAPLEKPRPLVAPEQPRRANTATARAAAVTPRRETPAPKRRERAVPAAEAPLTAAAEEAPSELPEPAVPAPLAPVALPVSEPVPSPPDPPEPRFEELIIPSSSVIGLQVETAISSERADVEDRVDARVTRDVLAAGRVAIPAGSRVIGAVTTVERGGKVKERARLGVRFHTVVLADGRQVPLRTEPILREGEAPTGESARKIGGAAVGGAILGAIMGGKKGAIIGGATGAGAGTAAVMAGDRNAATLPAGAIVTVRLAAPATIEVERR